MKGLFTYVNANVKNWGDRLVLIFKTRMIENATVEMLEKVRANNFASISMKIYKVHYEQNVMQPLSCAFTNTVCTFGPWPQ